MDIGGFECALRQHIHVERTDKGIAGDVGGWDGDGDGDWKGLEKVRFGIKYARSSQK
jgi:hypothetical protein